MNTVTTGRRAAERCDDFGWHPQGRIDPRLVAETMQHPSYGMGRAWSRSAGYRLTEAPERIYLVYTIEGGFEFEVDGAAVVADAHSLILLDGEAPTTARTLTTTARFVWYLEPTFLRASSSRFRFHEPVSLGDSSVRALSAMTNSMLNTPAPSTASAQRHLGIALEHLIAGALEEAGSELGQDSRHRDGVFMAAQLAIEAHFRDPAFDVSQLAREVSVSARTLHGTFARLGTTPRREIERRRIAEANALSDAATLSAATMAERAGFSSTKQLRRALVRTSDAERSTPRS